MAAEDYFPTSPGDSSDTDFEEGGVGYGSQGFDHEWNEASDPRTCKRCGGAPLYWRMTPGGWRLHNIIGVLHVCKQYPTTPASIPAIMAPTTIPSPESPIMDKNAVAFIRNDVRTLSCVFLPNDRDTQEISFEPSSISARVKGLKAYTYLTTDPDITKGDWCVVIASGQPKVVYVLSAKDSLEIEPNAPYTYAFVVSKVDFIPYNTLLEQNSKISELVKASYKESIRRGFRETLLAGLPTDQQSAITILLSGE